MKKLFYHDMGDSPHAQEYYLKALEAGKSSADHAMLGRIYANLGSMYDDLLMYIPLLYHRT
jgi:hypothetical protein